MQRSGRTLGGRTLATRRASGGAIDEVVSAFRSGFYSDDQLRTLRIFQQSLGPSSAGQSPMICAQVLSRELGSIPSEGRRVLAAVATVGSGYWRSLVEQRLVRPLRDVLADGRIRSLPRSQFDHLVTHAVTAALAASPALRGGRGIMTSRTAAFVTGTVAQLAILRDQGATQPCCLRHSGYSPDAEVGAIQLLASWAGESRLSAAMAYGVVQGTGFVESFTEVANSAQEGMLTGIERAGLGELFGSARIDIETFPPASQELIASWLVEA